jgi:3'-5' exoribonuclease
MSIETPDPNDRMPLRQLTPGELVEGAVCLRRITPGVTKAGDSYLTVELCNSSGFVSGRIWSEHVEDWRPFAVGAPLHVSGAIKPGYKNGPPEIVVARVTALPPAHPVALEINAICPVPLVQLRERYEHLLATMSRSGAELVRVVVESAGEDDFWQCPAAKVMHHAYIHGLAEHSIEVCELALALARSTPAAEQIQYDQLIAGALLHDVAKVREYHFRGVAIDLSRTAHLTYHTCSGPALTQVAVERYRDRLISAGVTQLDVDHLCHVQVSHHGVAEFGSPVPPATVEAALIHHADMVSAKLRATLDDLAAYPVDADGWVTPTGWKRMPILSLAHAPRLLLAAPGIGARECRREFIEERSHESPGPMDSDEGYSAGTDQRSNGVDAPLVRLRIIT